MSERIDLTQIAFDCMNAEHWEHKDTQPYVCMDCFQAALKAQLEAYVEAIDTAADSMEVKGDVRSPDQAVEAIRKVPLPTRAGKELRPRRSDGY